MDEVSVGDFLGQLGQSFLKYEQVFRENEFVDCGTLKTMDIEQDLPEMFNSNTIVLPLGHRRKLETALRHVKTMDTTGHEGNPPEENRSPQQNQPQEQDGFDQVQQTSKKKLEEKSVEREKLQQERDFFNQPVSVPANIGNNKIVTCSNCHTKGHKESGNRDTSACPGGNCPLPPCKSWSHCGQKKKHKDHGQQIMEVNSKISRLDREIKDLQNEIENVHAFKEKQSSSFLYVIKGRLKATNPGKYRNLNKLTKDLLYLKTFYGNKIPDHPKEDDNEKFPKALEKMTQQKKCAFSLPTSDETEDRETPPAKTMKMTMPSFEYSHPLTAPQPVQPFQANPPLMGYPQWPYQPYSYPCWPFNLPGYMQVPTLTQDPPLPLSPPLTSPNPPLPPGPPPAD